MKQKKKVNLLQLFKESTVNAIAAIAFTILIFANIYIAYMFFTSIVHFTSTSIIFVFSFDFFSMTFWNALLLLLVLIIDCQILFSFLGGDWL